MGILVIHIDTLGISTRLELSLQLLTRRRSIVIIQIGYLASTAGSAASGGHNTCSHEYRRQKQRHKLAPFPHSEPSSYIRSNPIHPDVRTLIRS